MSYKPIEYIPQTTNRRYIEQQPEQDEPVESGYWTTVALKLYRVVAALAIAGMMYLVGIYIAARLL